MIIGRSWLRSFKVDERQHLSEEDYVRFEIETAFSNDVPVIPVLVEGAHMPKPDDLPETIRELSIRQALEVSESRWQYDVDRLIQLIAIHRSLCSNCYKRILV